MTSDAQTHTGPPAPLSGPPTEEDRTFQERSLQGVSRTFALTIPQLPESLREVVGNAYLLCRIADTIEDSDTLTLDEKRRFSGRLVEVVEGTACPAAFARDLAPRLGGSTLEAERDLVAHADAVLRITRAFPPEDRAALARCVRIMAGGMEEFQEGRFANGLRDQRHLDAYCYYVAGVVGEMLTDLFCSHSAATARRRDDLARLAVSFGQGLQMTNILKDVWDDRRRNVCWLPRDTFSQAGFDLDALGQAPGDRAFEAGLATLIGVARGHLEDALAYTLLIPKSEAGIRRFCLWALGMAVLTLREINRHPGFAAGREVKISRRSVRATIVLTRLLNGSNTLLRALFSLCAWGLPRPARA